MRGGTSRSGPRIAQLTEEPERAFCEQLLRLVGHAWDSHEARKGSKFERDVAARNGPMMLLIMALFVPPMQRYMYGCRVETVIWDAAA